MAVRFQDPDDPPLGLIDPGARGLRDINGDPIGLCTEILGCESCSEEAAAEAEGAEEKRWEGRVEEVVSRVTRRRRSERGFPPPLTWLAAGGRRSLFMRSEREGGRLRITEVRVDRPEKFLASRAEGRLRLRRRVLGIADGDRDEMGDRGEGEGREEAEEGDERGERGKGRSSEWRCQEAMSGEKMAFWWINVTMA